VEKYSTEAFRLIMVENYLEKLIFAIKIINRKNLKIGNRYDDCRLINYPFDRFLSCFTIFFMIALSRFFLFGSVYLVILILSAIAAQENEYFMMVTFLITSICVATWLYYLHFKVTEPSQGLKEILYVVLFLTIFTTIWSFFNIYIESAYFIHTID